MPFSLHIGRMKLMASEVFKILHNLSPSYIQDLVKEKVLRYDFRNKKQTDIPQVSSKRYGVKSFRFEAAQVQMKSDLLKTTSNLRGCCRPGMG